MSDYRLTIPRLEIRLDTGEVFEVQALNPDLIRWDRTAAQRHWPAGSVAPFLWMTFLAWSAAKREGLIPSDMSFETFGDERCINVRNLTDEGVDTDGVDPTPLEVVPG